MTSRSSHRQIVKRRFSRRERATAAREGKKPKHYTPPRKRRVRPRLDPAVLWPTEKEFMARFRFPVERVRQLTEMFRRSRACPSKGDRRGCGIPIFHKVCYALRFLATGANYGVIMDTQGGVPQSTISRAVHAFINFLNGQAKHWIRFPKGADMHEASARFANKYKFDCAVGCIDGTHIPIQKPLRNEGAFVCRKGYHSLNVLVCTDADGRFTYVESGAAGAMHDHAVLEMSGLGQTIATSNRLGHYFLLADNGYGLSENVIVPFSGKKSRDMTKAEAKFQKRHIRARGSVERALGQLKTRWRCLSKQGAGVVKMNPLEASWLVVACCVLHNMCIAWGLSELSPQNCLDPDLEVQIRLDALASLLEAKRDVQRNCVPARHRVPRDKVRYEKGNYRRQMLIHLYDGGPPPPALPKYRYSRRK